MTQDTCKWILFDYKTICPEEHTDVCDGSLNKPYWMLPERYKDVIKFCPYCGKPIDFSKIETAIENRNA